MDGMRTGILLVTHPGIGSALLKQARVILSDPLEGVAALDVNQTQGVSPEVLREAAAKAGREGGLLVMTDLPGSTPSNLAAGLRDEHCRVVSGLNLAMLIRAWNYRHRAPEELAGLAIEGGRKAVLEVP